MVLVLRPNIRNRLLPDNDGAHLFIEFLFTVVFGGAVAIIYQYVETRRTENRERIERERESRMDKRAALEDFYRSLLELHNRVKKVRRTLRAYSFEDNSGGHSCERHHFETVMDHLEDAQLEAETKKGDIDLRKLLFAPKGNEMSKRMCVIEKYLNKLLAQYEDCYDVRLPKRADEALHLCAELNDFIADRDNAPAAETGYFSPSAELRKLMIGLLEDKSVALSDH